MRISFLLISVLLANLFGISSCTPCRCCGQAIATVRCNNDSVTLNIYVRGDGSYTVQNLIASAQDTVNYYTAKGYTCTQSVGPDGLNMRQICGPLRIEQAENGGEACVVEDVSIYNCEP